MPLSSDDIIRLIPTFLLHSHNYSVVVTDLEGKYIFVNELFKERFSFVTTDFIGLPFQATVHPEDVEKCNEAAYYCITHPNETVSLLLRKPEDEFRSFYWTSWEFSLFKDQDGQAVGILCIGHDITEELVIKEKLIYAEYKLRAILDSSESINILINADFQILILNKKAKATSQRLLGKNIREGESLEQYLYVLGDREAKFKHSCQEALAGKRVESEEKICGLDGQTYYFNLAYYPAYNEAGQIIGVAISAIDVSEQKKLEEELKKMQVLIDATYHSSLDAKIVISREYKILYFNRITVKLAKEFFEKEPQIGENYLDYVSPCLQEQVKMKLESAFAGTTERNEDTNGKKWFQFTYFPVFDRNNELLGAAVDIRDISELKKIQLTLEKNEKRLEILVNNFPEGFISLIDKDLRFLYINGTIYKDYAIDPSRLIGKPISKFFPKRIHDKILELLPKLLSGEHNFFEIDFMTKTFLNTFQPLTDEQGQLEGFVHTAIDITERKKNEENIKKKNRLLEEIAWLQSHEIRRPVANILGLIHLIKMENEYEEYKNKIYFEHLLSAAEELDQVIHKIVEKANSAVLID
jgi:PAS domain S-box-containing protein